MENANIQVDNINPTMATVGDLTARNGTYWHELLDSIDGGSRCAVTLALMYLAQGEDYAYHMAGQFAKGLTLENQWKDERIKNFKLRTLKNTTGPLSTLLNSMEKKNLLISRKESVGKKDRKYFSINPVILLSPDGSNDYLIPSYSEITKFGYNEKKISAASKNDIKEFLRDLEKENPKGTDADTYFNKCFL